MGNSDFNRRELAARVLRVASVLCHSDAVSDTIWMPNSGVGITAFEELAMIAADLGATDEEIESASQNKEVERRD